MTPDHLPTPTLSLDASPDLLQTKVLDATRPCRGIMNQSTADHSWEARLLDLGTTDEVPAVNDWVLDDATAESEPPSDTLPSPPPEGETGVGPVTIPAPPPLGEFGSDELATDPGLS